MDVKDYRKAYEAELAAPAAGAETSGAPNTFGAAVAPHEAARLAEIQRVPLARDGFADKIPALIVTLRNGDESTVVRLAALRALRAAMFLGDLFAPFRADFLAALRQLAQQGTDAQLCEGALAVLAAGCAIIAFGVVAYILDDSDLKAFLAWMRGAIRWRS